MWEEFCGRVQNDSERLSDLMRKIDILGLENEFALGRFRFKEPFGGIQQTIGNVNLEL